jgi:hypothetical protein
MSEEKTFGISVGAGMDNNTKQAAVTMEISGTPYKTQMTPEQALDLAANFTKAAHVADHHAILYQFFTQLGQLPEEEISQMLVAVGAYMQATDEERAEMEEEITSVREMVMADGPPSPEKIEAAREAYRTKNRRNGDRHG